MNVENYTKLGYKHQAIMCKKKKKNIKSFNRKFNSVRITKGQ